MKWIILIFLLGTGFILSGQKTSVTILIDPGHGGKDPGHLPLTNDIGQEKEIALIISTKLGIYLSTNLSNVNVLYTRTGDTYPSLDERVEMANSNNVDYMLSIHVNGSDNPETHGTETHIHSFDAKVSYQWALLIEDQFKRRAGRKSRGVKTLDDIGHSLQVLKYTKMPTVLVECGFLTNTNEATFLNSDYGQDILASAIFRATRDMLKKNHPDIDFSPVTNQVTQTDQKSGPVYKIQIMSSVDSVSTNIEQFNKLDYPVERVHVESAGNFKYKYYVGPFTDKQEAKKVQKDVQAKGFADAFIVQFD
ncbi:MAG: N-acetylmuramoyl-L-alanine amidase [Crocinitomicaceae bacterium]|nr:N-acetylmuramoyl-L-alanine amidase [Crocinitomicaceae bacterium]